MWRYHPKRKVVEVLSAGPVNPWGHDWDEHGELFFVNTVGGHLWHFFQGAHYRVLHTIDANPRAYDLLDMHADHWHFDVAKGWTNSRDGAANSYGGGHAHTGAMIYLADNWPPEYRGCLFTLNFFGRRANEEILERSGSGYVGRHGGDKFLFGDGWFRGIDLSYGPDGGVYVLDWSDTGECHESTGVHRTSGRIYKITYGKSPVRTAVDLAQASDAELADLQRHGNEWCVRQARLQLTARAAKGDVQVSKRFRDMAEHDADPVHRLRAMWSLHGLGEADEKFLRARLGDSDEHVRVWAIRLLTDSWPIDTVVSHRPASAPDIAPVQVMDEFCRLAESDRSGLVCLALASALQRLPVGQRAQLAAPLVARAEFADDHNLPLLIWYGLIPLADVRPDELAEVGARCEMPLTLRFISRRLGEDIARRPQPLDHLLQAALKRSEKSLLNVLAGLAEACRGLQKASRPATWDMVQEAAAKSAKDDLHERVQNLSVLFGDGRALDEVRRVVLDNHAELGQRKAALETLIDARPDDLRETCERLLSERFINVVAVRGLTLFDDPAIGKQLAANYSQFHPTERPAVVDALASRPAFAGPLLEAVAAGVVPRGDVSPFHARQILAFNDLKLSEQLGVVWGAVRDSPADKQALIAQWKEKLTPAFLARADKSAGRAAFNAACANCHRLYGQGESTGLDLTGSSRNNLDFLLDNIVDPSAVVNADFRLRIVNLEDGRTLTGVVVDDNERTLTLRTAREKIAIDRANVLDMRTSPLSLMPDGLLESLADHQARDLIAYLMHPAQVDLPAAAPPPAPAGK
jgi:putative heme-binding domain-containing protein